MQSYIDRKLKYEIKNDEGTFETITVEDSQLLDIARSKPVVILADAGMGKTLLMEKLAESVLSRAEYRIYATRAPRTKLRRPATSAL